MKLRVGGKPLWFRNNCIKLNPDKFHLLLSDEKVITWIFGMRSFQEHAVKRFSELKFIISLLLKNTSRDCTKKRIKKSMQWQKFHLVSRFTCNTRMRIDARSSPPVSHVI